MVELKNSELLEKLLEYAKSIGDSSNPRMTAERFLLSAIDFALGISSLDFGPEARAPIAAVLHTIREDEKSLSELRQSLIAGPMGVQDVMDSLFFQQSTFEAMETAKKSGLNELTPELLLKHILEKPSGSLKKAIGRDKDNTDIDPLIQTGKIPSFSFKPNNSDLKPEVHTGEKQTGDIESKNEAEPETKEDDAQKKPKSVIFDLVERVKNMHDKLSAEVLGQENAIGVFTEGFFQAEISAMTEKDRHKPRATFLLAGPPGVGKTMLAKKAAELIGYEPKQFDMSEYCDKEAAIEFIGSDAVYKGAKKGNLTDFVAKNPKCVLIFDEIEKAHISIIHLFLQILDQGRIRDSNTDAELDLSDAILFFTTNAGKQLYEESEFSDLSGITRKVILKALEQDVNPETKAPFFPPAICSRFASGNVVMFNYISAHDLRTIARKVMLEQVSNFERTFGIKVIIDELVYSALLYSEGGTVDARTISSRAVSFINTELYELFRLLDSDKVDSNVRDIETITIGVKLPSDNKEIISLFKSLERNNVMLISSDEVFNQCTDACPDVAFLKAQTVDDVAKVINGRELGFVLVDLSFGQREGADYLNIEDADSTARDLFWYVREHYPDMPVYFLQKDEHKFNNEERLSFMRQGVRGFVSEGGFSNEIGQISEVIHQQHSIEHLARANKIVSFETGQTISPDGKTANINLFDFEFSVAVDAEDSKNVLSNISKPNVRFSQVRGAKDAKKELMYFVDYLKNPKKYLGTGVRAPKGVLLYGPPGTGKTMLAKAMASESDVTFISAEGNQFVNKYQGEGKNKVKELFRTARKYAPSIIFVDEIDAIAKERRGGDNSGDIEITLTSFLTEMDGFKNDTSKPVFVLAATNFDIEPGGPKSLDPALLRRFDRRIFIDLPNREDRKSHLQDAVADKSSFDVSEDIINNISIRSTGMSLADLESVIDLALRTAIREGNDHVTDELLEEAFETFIGGETKQWDASRLESTARHEAGHAFICWQSGGTPSYVTIVARGNYGGYMQSDDKEGKFRYTKDDLLTEIRISLGGRAAEIVYYGEKDGISTGAGSDLAKATNLARQIICTYGMDDNFGLAVIDQQAASVGDLSSEVRKAVNCILKNELQNAIKLIEENKPSVDALVERLLVDNHLSGEEIKSIFESVK